MTQRFKAELEAVASAKWALAEAMMRAYPVGSEIFFEWTDGRQHLGNVMETREDCLYVRSRLDNNLRAVTPERIME